MTHGFRWSRWGLGVPLPALMLSLPGFIDLLRPDSTGPWADLANWLEGWVPLAPLLGNWLWDSVLGHPLTPAVYDREGGVYATYFGIRSASAFLIWALYFQGARTAWIQGRALAAGDR